MKISMPRMNFWRAAAVLILALAAYGSWVRFYHGLGASTGLSDGFPWGLWIGFDVLVGVGLAASGFTIAATVHIFNMEKYESISRPSVLTAFLGYLLVCLALIFEIGRPLRLWHPLIMWNPHSVMFEVAWCVTLYTTVLALEFSPMVFERFRLKLPLKMVRTIYLPVVIVGVVLSTLHQSSLGTYFVIVPDKLYGLWYTPMLPLFFFLTAISAGLAMTIIQSVLSARAFGRELKPDVLMGLARVIVIVLSVYIAWKFVNLSSRGNLPLAFQFTPKAVLFWTEIGLGAILPVSIIFLSGSRISEGKIFLAAILVAMGFCMNRLNVSITGMAGSDIYFPKWTEIAVSIGLVTTGFVLFSLAVRFLPVFTAEEEEEGRGTVLHKHYTPIPLGAVIALWGVVLLAGVAYALADREEKALTPAPPRIERKVDISKQELGELPKDAVIKGSGDSPGPVKFSHADHVGFQDRPECGACHLKLFSYGLNPDAPRPSGEGWHETTACGSCHNGKEGQAFKVKGHCERCHAEE